MTRLTSKNDVETLEDVLEDGHVTGEKDQGDEGGVRDARDARVLPLVYTLSALEGLLSGLKLYLRSKCYRGGSGSGSGAGRLR